MNNARKLNLTSLNVVRDELMVTIEQAATHLEGFIADRDNPKLLQTCIDSLQQIRGSLDLIELHGARELAGELLHTANTINEGKKVHEDERLSALTRGFFVLSCYFEYALSHEKGMPVILLPFVNDIRSANRNSIFPESFFLQNYSPALLPVSKPAEKLQSNESLSDFAKRCRHMYQIGLVGVIKELRVDASFQMMRRAVEKIAPLARESEQNTFWQLSAMSLVLFQKGLLETNRERKRVFSQIDQAFKQLVKQGEAAFNGVEQDLEPVVKELAYLIALADVEEKPFSLIKPLFELDSLDFNEAFLRQERKNLTGPNASTVMSVAQTLRDELMTAKDIVEVASESSANAIDNIAELITSITRVRDILAVIGLEAAANAMTEQLDTIKSWSDSEEPLETNDFITVADAFLYTESVLISIEQGNFSDEQLNQINAQSHSNLMMKSQLEGAQLIVLEEAEAGLSLVKRALTAFTDSSFDRAHIKNISKTLNGVRGGLMALELNRAVAVLASAIKFVDDTLLTNTQPAAIEPMLDTFADALMCLEYYLDCMKVDKNISSDTLVIAEESLAALGYGVSYNA